MTQRAPESISLLPGLTVEQLPGALSQARQDRRLTLREVEAQTGISSSTLSRIENGLFRPNSAHLLTLCSWLELGLTQTETAKTAAGDTMTEVALILKGDPYLRKGDADRLLRAWRAMYQAYLERDD